MKQKLCFRKSYFVYSVILFIVEVLIAKYAHDEIIRPYAGDFLVVILLYCMIRTVLDLPVIPVALAVLVISYVVETLQYFHLANRIGLPPASIARILVGDYFTWMDIFSYTLGIVAVLLVEKIFA